MKISPLVLDLIAHSRTPAVDILRRLADSAPSIGLNLGTIPLPDECPLRIRELCHRFGQVDAEVETAGGVLLSMGDIVMFMTVAMPIVIRFAYLGRAFSELCDIPVLRGAGNVIEKTFGIDDAGKSMFFVSAPAVPIEVTEKL